MNEITYTSYNKEVESMASYIITLAQEAANDETNTDELEELINDSILHEQIDSHEWIIYTWYNLQVLKFSDNADYMIDNIGGEVETLSERGLDGLHCALAFWALYADVQDSIIEQLKDI